MSNKFKKIDLFLAGSFKNPLYALGHFYPKKLVRLGADRKEDVGASPTAMTENLSRG
jgi:hypothetical protein